MKRSKEIKQKRKKYDEKEMKKRKKEGKILRKRYFWAPHHSVVNLLQILNNR